MKGQARALIPAVSGIITLLLAGITGCSGTPGEQQAVNVAATRAITSEQARHQELDIAFRDGANAAAGEIGEAMITDLAIELKSHHAIQLAAAEAAYRERG